MFEFKPEELQKGDEFTIDDGHTWHIVSKVIVEGPLVTAVCSRRGEIQSYNYNVHMSTAVRVIVK